MNKKEEKKGLTCPTCGNNVSLELLGKGGAFPFCSDRCKLIDLGKWIDCKYKVTAGEDSNKEGISEK